MKKCIEIFDFEDKETQTGKKYTRFKTSEGWISCFDSKSNEELKKNKERKVNVEVIESGEFKNIKKFLSPASETLKVQTEKVEKAAGNGSKKEMYVSYAKDVFCELIGRVSQKEFEESKETIPDLMDLAIEGIKKAEKAFS